MIAQLPFNKIVLVSLELLKVCNFDFVLNSNSSQNPVVLFLISEALSYLKNKIETYDITRVKIIIDVRILL